MSAYVRTGWLRRKKTNSSKEPVTGPSIHGRQARDSRDSPSCFVISTEMSTPLVAWSRFVLGPGRTYVFGAYFYVSGRSFLRSRFVFSALSIVHGSFYLAPLVWFSFFVGLLSLFVWVVRRTQRGNGSTCEYSYSCYCCPDPRRVESLVWINRLG